LSRNLEYHGETLQLAPLILEDKVYKCIKILKMVGKLTDSSTNPEIMALKACIEGYAKSATTAFHAISNHLKINQPSPSHQQRLSWYHQPLSDPDKTHEHDGHTWQWCHCCNANNSGHWVCSHTATTHRGSYMPNNNNNNKKMRVSTQLKSHILNQPHSPLPISLSPTFFQTMTHPPITLTTMKT
jgi:hypothetical protein